MREVCAARVGESMDDKQKHMRRLKTMWDLHNNIRREEKRKAEILEVFEGLVRLSKHRVEAPHSPPWSPTSGGRPPEEIQNDLSAAGSRK